MISTTSSGVQDHALLLSAYTEFDHVLAKNNVQRPVVVISDGHFSRFDLEVLKFLFGHEMRLFILPPDTTDVTQKRDQVNQNIHATYRDAKTDLSILCHKPRSFYDNFVSSLTEMVYK